jgi:hypothetical protein
LAPNTCVSTVYPYKLGTETNPAPYLDHPRPFAQTRTHIAAAGGGYPNPYDLVDVNGSVNVINPVAPTAEPGTFALLMAALTLALLACRRASLYAA